jgi:prolipoprotein diacylglyceryltransferase
VFENRVLRRIFGPNREREGCRELYEELYDSYFLLSIIRMIIGGRAGHVARMRGMRNA